MKKMKYAGLALIFSFVFLSSWTTQDKTPHPTYFNFESAEEENIIYITAEGYSNPDFWIGKTQPVTWINLDSQPHSVTDDYGEFDSGPLKQGQSFTISFPHAGVWTYHDKYSKATGMISVMGRDE